MLPKHAKRGIVAKSRLRRVKSRAAGGTHSGGQSLFGYLEALKRRLNESADGLDYNELSFEEKQAAQALAEAGEARFVTQNGRTWVARHSPNVIKRFFSMGAYA